MKAEWDVRFRGFVMDRDESGFRPPEPEGLEKFMDAFGQELECLGADNVLIETTMSTGYVDLAVTVTALRFEEAVAVGSSLIRTAFHTAGASTPNWAVDWVEVKAARASETPDDPHVREELVDA